MDFSNRTNKQLWDDLKSKQDRISRLGAWLYPDSLWTEIQEIKAEMSKRSMEVLEGLPPLS